MQKRAARLVSTLGFFDYTIKGCEPIRPFPSRILPLKLKSLYEKLFSCPRFAYFPCLGVRRLRVYGLRVFSIASRGTNFFYWRLWTGSIRQHS